MDDLTLLKLWLEPITIMACEESVVRARCTFIAWERDGVGHYAHVPYDELAAAGGPENFVRCHVKRGE